MRRNTPFAFFHAIPAASELTYGGTVGWSVSLPSPSSGYAPFLAPDFSVQGTSSFIAGRLVDAGVDAQRVAMAAGVVMLLPALAWIFGNRKGGGGV